MANTFADIRIGVLGLVGDVDEIVATATTDALTFRDDFNLSRESGTLVGRFVLLSSGGNSGLVRRVVSNDKTTATVTFNDDLDFAVESGATATMINYRDQGITRARVDRAIKDAMRAVQEDYLLPTVVQSQGFDSTAPVIEVGESFRGVAGVDYQLDDGEWIEIDPVDWIGDRWSRTITIVGTGRVNAEGLTVRIRGYAHIALPTSDDDEVIVDYEWLTYQAASNLYFELARRRMDPTHNNTMGEFYGEKADERRSKVQMPPYAIVYPFYSA